VPAPQVNGLEAVCRFADNRFSSAVPEWEARNLPDRGPKLGRALAVPCIRRVKRLPVVPWEWARPVWLRRECRERDRQDVRARLLAVPVSAMFHAE
jgi:hypothetical protein